VASGEDGSVAELLLGLETGALLRLRSALSIFLPVFATRRRWRVREQGQGRLSLLSPSSEGGAVPVCIGRRPVDDLVERLRERSCPLGGHVPLAVAGVVREQPLPFRERPRAVGRQLLQADDLTVDADFGVLGDVAGLVDREQEEVAASAAVAEGEAEADLRGLGPVDPS
jgi:hypothetical protein